MESCTPITSIELTRQERLEVWMGRNGWNYKTLGELAGFSKTYSARSLKGETIPPHFYSALIEVVPADLLPRSEYRKPGRKPKTCEAA